jgi:hypothetical protein
MSNRDIPNDVDSIVSDQVEVIQTMGVESRLLKERFKKTESQEWVPSTVASELIFQATHLLNSVIKHLNPSGLIPIGPSEGIDKGIEDEVADVVFNLMNLANLSGVDISKALSVAMKYDYKTIYESQDLTIKASNILIQSGELWDAIFRREGFKHMSRDLVANEEYIHMVFGGIMVCTILLARDLNVDIYKGFSGMIADSNNSLDQMGIEK